MGTKLLIQNLAAGLDADSLESMFSAVGNVVSAEVQVIPSANGERRVGYVQMTTEQEVQDGIEHFNGQVREGMVLIVREDKPHVPDPNFQVPKRPKVEPYVKKYPKR